MLQLTNGSGGRVDYQVDVAYLSNLEPMLCLYCPGSSAKFAPFTRARSALREVFAGRSVDHLVREGQLEDLTEEATAVRPESWVGMHLPARGAYRLSVVDSSGVASSICVAGFGTNSETYQRARHLIIAAAGIVQQRIQTNYLANVDWFIDPIFQTVFEAIQRMASPHSLWDDECWFACQAEMRGHCARLSRHVHLRGVEQSFNQEIKGALAITAWRFLVDK